MFVIGDRVKIKSNRFSKMTGIIIFIQNNKYYIRVNLPRQYFPNQTLSNRLILEVVVSKDEMELIE